MRTIFRSSIVIAVWLTLLAPALAQVRIGGALAGLEGAASADDQPVTVSAQFTPATAAEPAMLMITADIAPGWHVYSLTQPAGGPTATKIQLAADAPARLLGEFQSSPAPTPRVDDVAWPGLTIEEHHERVTWYAPIEFAPGTNLSTALVAGKVRMLACADSCIPVNVDFVAAEGAGVPIGPLNAATAPIRAPTTSPAASGIRSLSRSAGGQIAAGVAPAPFHLDGSEVALAGRLQPASVQPGGDATLELTLAPSANWHVYAYSDADDKPGSKPTLIAFDQAEGLEIARPTTTAAVVIDNSVPEFGTMRYHEGPATWTIPIHVPAEAKPGDYTLSGVIAYQACESRGDGLGSCELPKAARFTTPLAVGGGVTGTDAHDLSFTPATYKDAATIAAAWAPNWSAATPSAQPQVAGNVTTGTSSRGRASLAFILGAALLGGFILNFMPCVLPVIGLKVMAFAEQGGESRGRIFKLNLAYAAGLIAVFLLLATLATLVQLGLGSENYGWGELYTMMWFKVGMTALVFAMALSFLGVWEIPIPGFAGSGTAVRLATREGYLGAIFKGVFTTILATPCSGPFLGPVFGYTIAQPPYVTYLIFLFVGLGMAAPYLLIGAFPSLLHKLPRPGAWMQVFKELMGFLLLGTVVYLISTIGQQYFIATLTMLLGIWFGCWLIGRTPLTATESARRTAWAGAVVTAALVGLMAFRFLTPGQFELPWQPYSPAALSTARAQGKTVLVDFTADWCLTCKTNLKLSLNRSEVRELVERNGVVTLVADWTDGNPTIKQALAELNSRSIPLLAIYPADPSKSVIVLPDVVTQSQVLEALERAGPSNSTNSVVEVSAASSPLN